VGLLSLVHPFGDLPASAKTTGSLLTDVPVPENVRHTLETKCADCHSTQAHLPVYSRIAPVSWLVQHDVIEGRKHLDLSSWQNYTQAQRLDLLNRIASEAKSGQMPPAQYTVVHRSAKLSADEQLAIYVWAKAERHRLREAEQK
jgi:cytochrome c